MLQMWLDQNQYSRKGILRYEAIFGRTYVSVGGEEEDAADVARPEPILQEGNLAIRSHLWPHLCERRWRRNNKGFLFPSLSQPGHEGAGHRLRHRRLRLL